jgi:hypothetical protein
VPEPDFPYRGATGTCPADLLGGPSSTQPIVLSTAEGAVEVAVSRVGGEGSGRWVVGRMSLGAKSSNRLKSRLLPSVLS